MRQVQRLNIGADDDVAFGFGGVFGVQDEVEQGVLQLVRVQLAAGG